MKAVEDGYKIKEIVIQALTDYLKKWSFDHYVKVLNDYFQDVYFMKVNTLAEEKEYKL